MRNPSFLFLSRLVFFFCLLLFIVSPAKADLNDELKSTFDGLVNVTPGGSYDTQRRGVIAGGSISMRNKIVHPNLVSWVPPNLNGGCGGIDLFAGSFSYINGAQFTQLSRSIAQAAVGYAFELAIEGMCPTCAQVISKLQSEVAKLNSLMRNSCEFAKTAVNATGLQAWRNAEVEKHAQVNTGIGAVDDYFNAKEGGGGQAPAKITIAHGHADDITGNVVWESIKTANAATWYAHGDQQLAETLMSLTGTAITNKKADNSDVKYDYRPPIIKLKDFMDGGNVEIYKCESQKCLLPDAGSRQTIAIEGLRSRAKKMIFGNCVLNICTGGILTDMKNRNGGNAYPLDEQKFIESTSPGIAGLLRQVATEKQSAALVGEKAVQMIAAEVANGMVNEMFDSVETAVKATGQSLDTLMITNMRDTRAQINEERRIAAESIAGINSLLALQESVLKALRTPSFHKTQ